MSRTKVVRSSRAESSLYLGMAREFAAEADVARSASRHDAALLLAVHAAISASDAVTVALAGVRSADPDHQRTVDLVVDVARGSDELNQRARQIRALLQKKNLVEYESRRTTATEGRDGAERAARLVEWASDTVSKAKV